MSRSVKYDYRSMNRHDLSHSTPICNAGQNGKDLSRAFEISAQLAIDLIKPVLAAAQHHQPVWTERHQLPTQFTTDTAPGSRDQHGLASHHVANRILIQLDRRTTQKIIDADFTNWDSRSTLKQTIQFGHDVDLNIVFTRLINQITHGFGFQRTRGNVDRSNVVLFAQRRQITQMPYHRNIAVLSRADLFLRHQPDDSTTKCRARVNKMGQLGNISARTQHESRATLFAK